MANLNHLLPLVRTGVIAVVGIFTLITLGISAHIVHLASSGTVPDWAGLALATSILTLLALPVMFIIPEKRRGAFPAFIAVEIVVVWILWILWIATAATIASIPGLNACSVGSCPEVRALEAFAFLNWLILMFYSFALLVLAVSAHARGNRRVWTSSVKEFDWNSGKSGVVGVAA